MQAVLNHPSRGAQGQFLKSSKGKLDDKITVILFLEDNPPLHEGFSKVYILHFELWFVSAM